MKEGAYFIPFVCSVSLHAVGLVAVVAHSPVLPVAPGVSSVAMKLVSSPSAASASPEMVDSAVVRGQLAAPPLRRMQLRERDRSKVERAAPQKKQAVQIASEAVGAHTPIEVKGLTAPEYPARSRKLGHEGRCVYRVAVSADGRVQEIILLSSSSHAALDRAARRALGKASFLPAYCGKGPCDSTKKIAFTFRLRAS